MDLLRVVLRGYILLLNFHDGIPQLPYNVVALGKQVVYSSLAFWDIGAHVELSVDPHVVD